MFTKVNMCQELLLLTLLTFCGSFLNLVSRSMSSNRNAYTSTFAFSERFKPSQENSVMSHSLQSQSKPTHLIIPWKSKKLFSICGENCNLAPFLYANEKKHTLAISSKVHDYTREIKENILTLTTFELPAFALDLQRSNLLNVPRKGIQDSLGL